MCACNHKRSARVYPQEMCACNHKMCVHVSVYPHGWCVRVITRDVCVYIHTAGKHNHQPIGQLKDASRPCKDVHSKRRAPALRGWKNDSENLPFKLPERMTYNCYSYTLWNPPVHHSSQSYRVVQGGGVSKGGGASSRNASLSDRFSS